MGSQMKLEFVVQINMKDGSKRFVSAKNHFHPRLVKRRSQATITTDRGLADIFNDWYWEKHWDYTLHDSRQVVALRRRPTK